MHSAETATACFLLKYPTKKECPYLSQYHTLLSGRPCVLNHNSGNLITASIDCHLKKAVERNLRGNVACQQPITFQIVATPLGKATSRWMPRMLWEFIILVDVCDSGLNLYWASTPSVCQDNSVFFGKVCSRVSLMFRPPLPCAFMTLVSLLINSRYGGLAPICTYDTAVLTNHALVTIKGDVGDSPPRRPRACTLLRTLCPIKLTFLIAVN